MEQIALCIQNFVRRWRWEKSFRLEFRRLIGCTRIEARTTAKLMFALYDGSVDPLQAASSEAFLWKWAGYPFP